jgi:NAD-dependent dihydropyrimidine dehydrogenase PreA subunit
MYGLHMLRKILHIDEALCDGCGKCVPACAEGAIVLAGGKARLADVLCDGLGACLGECPRGALTVVEREAEPFELVAAPPRSGAAPAGAELPACPGARPRAVAGRGLAVLPDAPAAGPRGPGAGALAHWPVQLRLVPAEAPFLKGADLLVAADCVPFACPSFHAELLAGRAVVVGCPKLDDLPGHLEKLARILGREDGPERVTVARMDVPCCAGLSAATRRAAQASGRAIPVREVVAGVDGSLRG